MKIGREQFAFLIFFPAKRLQAQQASNIRMPNPFNALHSSPPATVFQHSRVPKKLAMRQGYR
jgi:hypothetical protein